MLAGMAILMVPREGGNPAVILITQMFIIFGIFYFLLVRPQQKEQQKKREMIAALGKGDEILTVGGIVGTIVHVEEQRLTIKTADDTRLVVDRGHVSRPLGEEKKA